MKKRNQGFSLVELIVVIAIMIVLVAVLAPVFTKYVEKSRRATDVQNASVIGEAILVQVTDEGYLPRTGDATQGIVAKKSTKVNDAVIAGIQSDISVKGRLAEGGDFYYYYEPETNLVAVYIKYSSKPNLPTVGNSTPNLLKESNSTVYGDPEQDENADSWLVPEYLAIGN